MAAILVLLVAQTGGGLAELRDESRAVREAAIRRLAEDGPPVAELAAHLDDADARVAAGVIEVLRRRGHPDAVWPLARAAAAADPARGELAAAALVELAGRTRTPLESLEPCTPVWTRRVERALARLVEERLSAMRGLASLDLPQIYRFVYMGGRIAERALLGFLDGDHAGRSRAHALHAYARLVGRRAGPVLVRLLDDHDSAVRHHAAALAWRYGIDAGVARLVALADGERPVPRAVLVYAAAAAERLGRLGARGAARLERLLEEGTLLQATAAAAALDATHPERAALQVAARVRRLLELEETRAGAGLGAALFEFRVGPLPGELRARMARAHPLLQAAVADDRATALRALAPFLGPAAGVSEWLRIRVVARLLSRHDAPFRDRVALARSALRHENTTLRATGLRMLQGAPGESWGDLRPEAIRALMARSEAVRLAAAALFPGRNAARRACLDALYDGDPASARVAAALLGKAWRVDPAAPAAERRRQALRFLRRIGEGRDKE